MKNLKLVFTILIMMILTFSSEKCWSGKIYRPWRSTTAIVLAGESFEVWFDADEAQVVDSIKLSTKYHSVQCSFTYSPGDWEVDPLSGNRFNSRINVAVPADAPSDRYDLVIFTSTGNEISYGAVKVLKEFRTEYYIMHMSDGHLYQGGYNTNTLLARKSAMIDMANIMDCQLIIETGDNMYNVRNHPEREVIYFQGDEDQGINGMADASGASFLVPGDHDAYTANDWPQASVQVNSDFFNDYWGLQSSSFKYGNGRFMMLNNAWAVSETSAKDHRYQVDEAIDWLGGEGSGGNFWLTAGHCYNKMHEFIDESTELSLVLAGDKHHIRTNNPYSFDDGSPEIAYIAGSIRDHFEVNLFRINNDSGSFSTVSGENAVVEVLYSGDQDKPETWVRNLTLDFENDNDGHTYENTATLVNRFNFPILGARVRFIMPKGYDYKITNGIINQEFVGNEFSIIDVSLDLEANSTAQVRIGDADLCPDDPDKTEPGLCGCGVAEGNCDTAMLVVHNGTGDGYYFPYESVRITADAALENEEFDKWIIQSGTPEIKNIYNPSTELFLKDSSAEIIAVYKEIILVNDAAFLSHYIPPILPGEKSMVQVSMKNTGTTSWTKNKGYILGSQNPPGNSIWSLDRIDLVPSDSILTGQVKTFIFQITAPDIDSLFNFQWQMKQVDSSWFGETSYNQLIRTAGSDAYLDDCDNQSYWRSSGSIKLDNADKKQGNSCLSFSGSNTDEFKKRFPSPYDPKGSEESTILQFWYYVSDISKLTGKNQVELGSGGKNDADEYNWNLTGLINGWNYIRLPVKSAGRLGNPDLTAINWFRLYSFKSASITTKIDGIQLISDEIYSEIKLTVNSGSGSGLYSEGQRLMIEANAAPEGEIFDRWIIDAGDPQIENLDSIITYITISDKDAVITANYVADPSLDISGSEFIRYFQVYPNPLADHVNITFGFEGDWSLHIFDMQGRLRLSRTGNEKSSHLDLSPLDAGLYFFTIRSNEHYFARKITKL